MSRPSTDIIVIVDLVVIQYCVHVYCAAQAKWRESRRKRDSCRMYCRHTKTIVSIHRKKTDKKKETNTNGSFCLSIHPTFVSFVASFCRRHKHRVQQQKEQAQAAVSLFSTMSWKAGLSRHLTVLRFFACPKSPSSRGVM